MSKGVMGNGVSRLIEAQGVLNSVIEENSTNTCIHTFSFLAETLNPNQAYIRQSQTTVLLPIIPIGIVTYVLTLLRDNHGKKKTRKQGKCV